ncbi:SGNH/GDSL hydrolase family protein [Actinomadura keratinilytica]|jgi:lysophospholipase L1-like esterase|uniref:SGNH/GDSL hydrolase family protein n=1 Tax=Actinomadura keratinilytica TaxID=547461 RepID=A0ABP7Y9D3_9ACTN
MLRALTARRIATAAAYGGGGLTALGGLTFGLLVVEAKLARRIIQATPNGDPPVADGVYGIGAGDGEASAAPLSFVMLGDSTAAGLGVHEPDETPGALLAAGLSAIAGHPVRLTNVALSGARSEALPGQVDKALAAHPDIAVIMIGANDVTARVPAAESVRHLAAAVERLHGAGCRVVVGTCPDLGTVQPVMQPLRWIARRASRQLAAAQTIAVVERGGRTVSLGDLLGREFEADPREMFSADRYHPSARGYAAAAAAVLPSMAAALGLEPEVEEPPDVRRGEGILPVYLAAAEAAEEPGTEVAGTRVAGRERGPRGRWATLLRRREVGEAAGEPEDPETVRHGAA